MRGTSARRGHSARRSVYPTPEQAARLVAWEHELRWLWNLAHEQRLIGVTRQKAERRYYSAFDQIKQLIR